MFSATIYRATLVSITVTLKQRWTHVDRHTKNTTVTVLKLVQRAEKYNGYIETMLTIR